jgi:hypothetical protein
MMELYDCGDEVVTSKSTSSINAGFSAGVRRRRCRDRKLVSHGQCRQTLKVYDYGIQEGLLTSYLGLIIDNRSFFYHTMASFDGVRFCLVKSH